MSDTSGATHRSFAELADHSLETAWNGLFGAVQRGVEIGQSINSIRSALDAAHERIGMIDEDFLEDGISRPQRTV